MNKKLKFAVVGCGKIGKRHAQCINDKAILKAVCDTEEKKAKVLAQTYNATAYLSIDKMLANESDLDLVAICTPNGLHAIHSIKALKTNLHVLCEKPMAISIHDCEEMIKVAANVNKRLMIVKQNRFNPPIEAVKKLIDKGKLGKIYSLQLNCFWNRNSDYYKNSWKGTLKLDGGILYTQLSHFIDLLYWMFGDIKDMAAFGGNFHHQKIIEFEDSGVVILKFYNEAIGTINYTVNSYRKNMEGSLTIFAEKGTVKIGGQYLNELEYQNIENFKIENLPKGNPPNNYGHYCGSMSNHDKVYENVINVLMHGDIISTNGFEGLKTVEIINRIYRKMKDRFK